MRGQTSLDTGKCCDDCELECAVNGGDGAVTKQLTRWPSILDPGYHDTEQLLTSSPTLLHCITHQNSGYQGDDRDGKEGCELRGQDSQQC